MKNRWKRLTVYLLALFFILTSGFGPKVNATELSPRFSLDRPSMGQRLEPDLNAFVPVGDLGYQPDDTVRLIVQLTGRSLISYANSQGVKVSELDKNLRKSVQQSLLDQQKALKAMLRAEGIKMKELQSFNNVMNGFSIETTYGNLGRIQSMPSVVNVTVAHTFSRPEPNLSTSKDIVKAMETWNEFGFDGEGMVVSIIDTGIDPSHKDMVLTNPNKAKIQETTFDALPGIFHTMKVPYGYNYMDENQTILDLGPEASEHGMHVAGIVGANGNPQEDGVQGVAPEAQLLAMKVFGNNPMYPYTYGDIYIKAIDDSVALGADVINMSLGSTAAFVNADDLEQVAIRNAMENGVVAAISAGNSNLFGSGYRDPFTSNPDVGLVGSPGLSPESIQVASIENSYMNLPALLYILEGNEYYAPYGNTGSIDPSAVFEEAQPYVYVGLGKAEDFAGQDVNGKIALIQRGDITFEEKILNAQNAGATGAVIFNSAAGGNAILLMAYDQNKVTIPAVGIGRADGIRMVEAISTAENYVSFPKGLVAAPNPDAGKMSVFTSWGTTPNLDFKPEITAPGGNIYSTAQNDKYQIMSGTSMSAPHVAGGTALVLQRLDQSFQLSGSDRVKMAKNLLLATAEPHNDRGLYNEYFGLGDYNYTSPRRQGAGVMNLLAAVSTPVVVYEKTSGESKVALGEMDDISTFTLTLENFSDAPVTYRVRGTVQTDLTDAEELFIESQGVYRDGTIQPDGPNGFWSGDFPITFSEEEVTVPSNGKFDMVVTVDLRNAVDWFYNVPLPWVFENGTFVEGFVVLEEVTETFPSLSVPYMGFYGSWDEAPIFDASIYDASRPSYYGLTSLATYDPIRRVFSFLGILPDNSIDANAIVFSPNGNGVKDNVVPVLSFLRNARELEINILDEEMNRIRTLTTTENVRKNFSSERPFTAYDSWIWDGTANNQRVPEGQYYYQVKARIDYPDARWQELRFPVKVDLSAPVIHAVHYDIDTKVLSVDATDNLELPLTYRITDGTLEYQNYEGIFELNETGFTSKSVLVVTDMAGNSTYYDLKQLLKVENRGNSVGRPTIPQRLSPSVNPVNEPRQIAPNDKKAPEVYVLTPEYFDYLQSSKVLISGVIYDDSPMDYITINGTKAKMKWDRFNGGNYVFELTLEVPDGLNTLLVEAVDKAGNKTEFAHRFFVDTVSPEVEWLKEVPNQTTDDSIMLEAEITDNLPDLQIYVNQNLVANLLKDWSNFESLSPASHTLQYQVPLFMGRNIIVLEVFDGVGNKNRYEFEVTRITE